MDEKLREQADRHAREMAELKEKHEQFGQEARKLKGAYIRQNVEIQDFERRAKWASAKIINLEKDKSGLEEKIKKVASLKMFKI